MRCISYQAKRVAQLENFLFFFIGHFKAFHSFCQDLQWNPCKLIILTTAPLFHLLNQTSGKTVLCTAPKISTCCLEGRGGGLTYTCTSGVAVETTACQLPHTARDSWDLKCKCISAPQVQLCVTPPNPRRERPSVQDKPSNFKYYFKCHQYVEYEITCEIHPELKNL